MTTTSTYETARTYGDKPRGRANGTERWATITEDDGTLTVTAYEGWGITGEVRLSGSAATPLAEDIALGFANLYRDWDGRLMTVPTG